MKNRVLCSDAIRAAATYYGLHPATLAQSSREMRVVRARHLAMYVARVASGQSYPSIARNFDRDHTTVLFGVRKVAACVLFDESCRVEAEELIRRAEGLAHDRSRAMASAREAVPPPPACDDLLIVVDVQGAVHA